MKAIRGFIATHRINELGQVKGQRMTKTPKLTQEQTQLVEDHLRCLHKCLRGDPKIKWVVGFFDSYEDAFNQGVLAMMKAATKFEADRGLTFWNYAYWWVRSKLTRPAVGACSGLMVAEKISNTWNHRKWLNRADLDRCSDGESPALDRIIGYTDETSTDNDRQDIARQRVEIIRGMLHQREFDILLSRASGQTLIDIGARLGITRERVRQLESRARERLALRIRTWERTHGRPFPIGD